MLYLRKHFKNVPALVKHDNGIDCCNSIRIAGGLYGVNDRHNWDGYMVDGNGYLSLEDGLKLPENFELLG